MAGIYQKFCHNGLLFDVYIIAYKRRVVKLLDVEVDAVGGEVDGVFCVFEGDFDSFLFEEEFLFVGAVESEVVG